MSNNGPEVSRPLLIYSLAFGFLVNILLAVYAWAESSLSIFAVYTMVAWAAGSIGFAAGFLFALPRSVQELTPLAGDGQRGGTQITNSVRRLGPVRKFRPSNNLEQISDWLTKLLIGAGLVQLGAVGRGLNSIVGSVAMASIGHANSHPAASAKVAAGAVIIFYGVLGFLAGYVGTGLVYRRVLEESFEDSYENSDARPDHRPARSAERHRKHGSRWHLRIFTCVTTAVFAALVSHRRRSISTGRR